jgi:chaperonin cofactor prefoldin
MTRKLLPYEYDLIDALGVSKEEYLDFVAQQHIYEDVKEGTQLDVRAAETVAIILTIVGILFQVASVLLAPKPPSAGEGPEQTRDQRVGRRFGFNGAQELAKYGEAVPLVYTRVQVGNIGDNPNGGVRVSTLLLWSAILSFGNHQFMRLMMVIGASSITQIDAERTALGQFPASDLVLSNVWQYFNTDGPTQYRNLIRGTKNDPTRSVATQTTARIDLGGDLSSAEGFSQAFSPTTGEKVGVSAFIPVNADVLTLTPKGDVERRSVGISFTTKEGDYWPNSARRPRVPVGSIWTLIVPNTAEVLSSSDTPGNARQDALRAASSVIDNGSVFKAGSALFRVVSSRYTTGQNIEESNLVVKFECVRTGKMPQLAYGTTHWLDINSDAVKAVEAKIEDNEKEINKLNAQIERNKTILSANRGAFVGINGTIIRTLTTKDRNDLKDKIERDENRIALLQSRNSDLRAQVQQDEAAVIAPFYTKGLARVEEASYASVTRCHILDVALRFQVYRRISGRSNVYGSKQRDYGHSASDNGAKARTAMFAVLYRLVDPDSPSDKPEEYDRLPYIFCCRGFNEQDTFAYLKLRVLGASRYIKIKLETIVDPFTENRTFANKGYCYLDPGADVVRLTTTQTDNPALQVYFNGTLANSSDYPPYNRSPKASSEFDLFNYDAYTTSSFAFDNGPEIQITAVNEQLREPWANYSPILYQGLSTLGLHVISGAGTQDLRNVSVWVSEGKALRRISRVLNRYGNEATGSVNTNAVDALAASKPSGSSSFAPDIFLDTILDDSNGIGRYASLHSVDVMQLAISKRYCFENKLFMDGVIADQRSWRDFWAQAAPFSLLELGKIGGRETLLPALPYVRSTGAITRAVSITALFNQGNILDGSLKEEFIDYGANTQDVIVTVIYRDVERNGIFPRNNSVEVQLTGTNEDNAVRETIDASQFVTNRDQAIKLGKFLCNTRRHSRRAIEFQTFPTDSFVAPGAYIYVETSNNQWDGIYTGRIEAGGVLNVPIASRIRNDTYNVLTYGGGDGTRSFSNVQVTNGVAATLSESSGQLFVLGKAVRNKRVFRVTEVSMEEEGETTVRAVEHPCNNNGDSRIANGIASRVAGLFTIDGKAE